MALRDSGDDDDDDGNNESYGVVAIYLFNKHLLSTDCVPGSLVTSESIQQGNPRKSHILMRNRNRK